jgi:hypothetical protein
MTPLNTVVGTDELCAWQTARTVRRFRLPRLTKNAERDPFAVLSWQPKKASDVWTRQGWTNLCEHLQNGNAPTHFVMGFRDCNGGKRYVRSKRLPVDRAISWAWASIAGKPKSRLAFVPYSTNDQQQSRWGGMDFDAHDGGADRARELAFAAFRLLLNAGPELSVILETSGSGGWHVWAVSLHFCNVAEWVRLLKSVAGLIGTVIADSVCEIFPPDSVPSRFGKAMRAPGSWNPDTDRFNEIVWENTHTSLESVLSGKSKTASLNPNALESHFPDKRKKLLSLSLPPYREAELLVKLGITATATRNRKLASLVGEVFFQVGHEVARRLAQAQFRKKSVATKADETEHLASFEKLWRGLAEKWGSTLTPTEREILGRLETENERDAFRIIRSYACKAKQDGAVDFPIARDNLAERLGVTGKGAAWIRDKLTTLGAIAKTADFKPNKFAARFMWLPAIESGQS